MPRPSPYTNAQKSAILEAVKSGRKTGKKWPEILEAAEGVGFKGGLAYLMQFARAAGAVRGRRRKSVMKVVTAKGKPGRPQGRPKTIVVTGNGAGLADIKAIVARLVKERLETAVARAVKAVDAAAAELKN